LKNAPHLRGIFLCPLQISVSTFALSLRFMRIYLDNAATTPLDPTVQEAMMPYLQTHFGNPSSIHTHGREARTAVENARKTVAKLLKCSPSEIFFTSGATEADNTALIGSVFSLDVKHIITSPIEHHAVLHTAEWLHKKGLAKMHLVKTDAKGHVDLNHLEELLQNHPNALVSLMHGNNEIGNLTDIGRVSALCRQRQAYFHSDTVQTIGLYPTDLQKLDIDFIVGSAHKFHGPKGVGFLYINGNNKIEPHLHGGSQERNMRGGTENVAGIVGLAKALELAYTEMESKKAQLFALKSGMIHKLKQAIPDILFNGDCLSEETSLSHVLSISTPVHEVNEMLLFNLDIAKISVSGGSACTSGVNTGSHVLNHLALDPNRGAIRFSFSKYTTEEEIDKTVEVFKRLFN
jgi:cysteine desulfurase